MRGFKLPEQKFELPEKVSEIAGSKIGGFLKGMGIDVGQVGGMIQEMLAELKAHNAAFEALREDVASLRQIVIDNHVSIASTLEMRAQITLASEGLSEPALLADIAMLDTPEGRKEYEDKGLLDPALYERPNGLHRGPVTPWEEK